MSVSFNTGNNIQSDCYRSTGSLRCNVPPSADIRIDPASKLRVCPSALRSDPCCSPWQSHIGSDRWAAGSAQRAPWTEEGLLRALRPLGEQVCWKSAWSCWWIATKKVDEHCKFVVREACVSIDRLLGFLYVAICGNNYFLWMLVGCSNVRKNVMWCFV